MHQEQLPEVKRLAAEHPNSTLLVHVIDIPKFEDILDIFNFAKKIREDLVTVLGREGIPNDTSVDHLRSKYPSSITSGLFLLKDIPQAIYQRLLDHTFIRPQGRSALYFSSPALKLTQPQLYVGIIEDLFPQKDLNEMTGSSKSVNTAVVDAVVECEVIRRVSPILENQDLYRRYWEDNVTLTPLKVRVSRGRDQWVWAMYINKQRFQDWNNIHSFLSLLRTQLNENGKLDTLWMGSGRLNDLRFRCSRCRSHDHPAPHCPFPHLSGWNGAPPIVVSSPESNNDSYDNVPYWMSNRSGASSNQTHHNETRGLEREDSEFTRGRGRGRGHGRGRGRGRGGGRGRGRGYDF
jgi:hypothetical protein